MSVFQNERYQSESPKLQTRKKNLERKVVRFCDIKQQWQGNIMSAKHEIEAFLAELTHAWDKFDIELMVAAYAEDGRMISPFGSDDRGRSRIAETRRKMAPVFTGSKNHLHDLELRHIHDGLEFFDLTHSVQFASGQVRCTSDIHGLLR
jgi:hypothetical protein